MKLRYYLRGLGIGIFVTALIMGVAVKSHPQKMSESEIRAEAAKLGMVDGTTVLQAATEQDEENDMGAAEESEEDEHTVSVNDVANEDKTEAIDSNSSDRTEDDTQTSDGKEVDESQTEDATNIEEVQDSNEANTDESQDGREPSTDENQSQDDKSEEQPEESKQGTDSVETAKQTVTITIYPGEGSLPVAKRLEGLGVVENAVVFDKFLCRNGYDTRIRVGSFSIPVEASNEEIAKIITSR